MSSIDKAVDHILLSIASSQETKDLYATRINTAIKRAIHMSQVRGGRVTKPSDTAIYHFADAVKSAESLKDFLDIIPSEAIKNLKPSQYKSAFGLPWAFKFNISKAVGKMFGAQPRMNHVKPQLTPLTPEEKMLKEIESLKSGISKIKQQQKVHAQMMAKLKRLFALHSHTAGKIGRPKTAK